MSARVVIANELGMHARPATAFSETASAFECRVVVRRTDDPETEAVVDGTSLFGLLALALTAGTEIEIIARGADAADAVAALVEFVNSLGDV